MRLGGQKVLIAPPHPHEPNVSAAPFPHYGLEHIGLTVDDVDAAVEELRAKGAEIAIGPLTRNPGLRLALRPRTGRHHDRARPEVGYTPNALEVPTRPLRWFWWMKWTVFPVPFKKRRV
jgi:hypothetical protein